jgi:palmitoyltransferase ZDHHC9/14/18
MAERDLSPTSTSSTRSNITVRTDKQADARAMSSASPSISTPPTSLGDEASVLSESTKIEQAVEVYEEAPGLQMAGETSASAHTTTPGAATTESRRPARSSRKSVTTYNVQILAGTAIHTPTKYLEKHHKNVVHGSLESIAKKDNVTPAKKKASRPKFELVDASDAVEEQLVAEAAQAARRRTSSRVTDLRKEVLRNISGAGDIVASTFSDGKAFLQGTLRHSASVPHLKSGQSTSTTASLKRSRAAMEDAAGHPNNQSQEEKAFLKPKSKVWLKQGLYVGQDRDFDARLSESQNRAKKRAKKPKGPDVLPLPMFACDRLLNEDPRHVFRDFKLSFDTYCPLPRKVKVDGWVKLNKSKKCAHRARAMLMS